MSIVFGPVNSRRFGVSLGINLSPNEKCCNFDCLYCELKSAKIKSKILNPPLVEDIIDEVKKALEIHKQIDVLTITANGEPSLYPNLKELVDKLNLLKTTQKLLILSNATAVLKKSKFDSLMDIDIVKFSLDSAVEKTFRKIDRGFKDINLKDLIDKMAEFKNVFKGELILEILVVKGLNDTAEEFKALNLAIEKINPHRVDIGSIDRPPAYKVQGVSSDKLRELSCFITSSPVIIASHKYSKRENFTKDEILQTLSLRPQSAMDIELFFDDESKKRLFSLMDEKKIEIVNLAGINFYKTKESIN